MKLRQLIAIACGTLLATACHKGNPNDPLAETGRTQRTENLLKNMALQADTAGYMFGHQDDTAYGIGWVGDSARSDVKSVCNDYPAVIGFDLGHIELGDTCNLDGVPFDHMRQCIIDQFDRGGMVTLSWHLDNPVDGGTAWIKDAHNLTAEELSTVKSILPGGSHHDVFMGWMDQLANFLNSLITPYGVKVPVLFRPWHEHTGSWFWWGQAECSTEQYQALWKMTREELNKRKVTNCLFAYSPGTEFDGDPEKYMERYPGDEYVDVLGLDTYCNGDENDTLSIARYADNLDRYLGVICQVAKDHGKVPALTETGFESLKTEDWWTKTLGPVLDKHNIAYVLVWRNAHDKPGHFYAPYPGHKSVKDFVHWYNQPKTLFLHDVNALYH